MDAAREDEGCGSPRVHPALVDRLLREALGLGQDLHDALERNRDAEVCPLVRLHGRHELGTLVACLAHAVVWLLAQKAIAAGNLDRPRPSGLGAELARPRVIRAAVDAEVWALGDRVRAFGARIDRLASGSPIARRRERR